ncbi:MAG: hypothetical protein ACE5EH_07385 [Gammaproteobacteria bacterium]
MKEPANCVERASVASEFAMIALSTGDAMYLNKNQANAIYALCTNTDTVGLY